MSHRIERQEKFFEMFGNKKNAEENIAKSYLLKKPSNKPFQFK